MSDRNTFTVQPDTVGYLCWVRTARDPTVEKIDAVHRNMYLTAGEWKAKTIGQLIPLDAYDYALSLDQLATKYPCPQEKIDGTL